MAGLVPILRVGTARGLSFAPAAAADACAACPNGAVVVLEGTELELDYPLCGPCILEALAGHVPALARELRRRGDDPLDLETLGPIR